MSKSKKKHEYFDFEVSICWTNPVVFRRFLLRKEKTTFLDLNDAIQAAFGWTNSHLWHFMEYGRSRPGAVIADIPSQGTMDFDFDFGDPLPSADQVLLTDYFRKAGRKAVYEYDFGDSWIHEVTYKRTEKSDEKFDRKLIAGELAGPLEDCGGVVGYYQCVNIVAPDFIPALADELGKADDQHIREWIEDVDWHPEAYDLEKAKLEFDRKSPPRRSHRWG